MFCNCSLVRFHPDSSRLLLFAADDEYSIRAWKLDSSSCVSVLRGHYSAVTAMEFTPDGSLLYRYFCTPVSICDAGLITGGLCVLCKRNWICSSRKGDQGERLLPISARGVCYWYLHYLPGWGMVSGLNCSSAPENKLDLPGWNGVWSPE